MELELPRDFKEFLRSLAENDVEYLVIGGYAVALHGFVRNTNDLDIVVSDDPANAVRLIRALTEFGFGGRDLTEELFTSKNSLVRMGVEPLKIEILNYLKGVDFNKAFQRRNTITVEDIELNLISFEDLIANKTATGRPQDLVDAEKLIKYKRGGD